MADGIVNGNEQKSDTELWGGPAKDFATGDFGAGNELPPPDTTSDAAKKALEDKYTYDYDRQTGRIADNAAAEKTATPDSAAPAVPAADATEKPKDGETPPAAEPQLDESLVRRATSLGLTEDEAKSFKFGWRLQAVLDRLDGGGSGSAATPGETQTTQPRDAASPPAAEEELGEDFDERLVKKVKTTDSKIGRLAEENAQLRQALIEDRFDKLFDRLDETTVEFTGRGPRFLLDGSSEQGKVRGEIEKRFQVLANSYAQAGQRASIAQVFDEAVQAVLGKQLREKEKENVLKEVSSKVTKRASQQISRATHRAPQPATRTEKAASFADQFYRDRNMLEPSDQTQF